MKVSYNEYNSKKEFVSVFFIPWLITGFPTGSLPGGKRYLASPRDNKKENLLDRSFEDLKRNVWL